MCVATQVREETVHLHDMFVCLCSRSQGIKQIDDSMLWFSDAQQDRNPHKPSMFSHCNPGTTQQGREVK